MNADVIDGLRQPEYTGENRCIPCTVVNVVIALAASAAAGAAGVALVGGTTAGAGAGLGVLALCLAAIYLRGYLVPGTPTLTKQYLPDRVLRWFDKAPEPATAETVSDVNPERELVAAGALEPCEDVDDLCLTDSFRTAFDAALADRDAEDIEAADALAALGVEESDSTLDRHRNAVVLRRDGRRVGQWESEAALLADVATADVLAERHENWDRLDPVARGQLLNGLRLFVESCPVCDGDVRFGEETVESCCRSYEVVAATCTGCDSRFFEADLESIQEA